MTQRSTFVTSTFGVMFTADQEAAAQSMLRVLKSGGRIGMANWTAAGFIGQVFKTIGRPRAATCRRSLSSGMGIGRPFARAFRSAGGIDLGFTPQIRLPLSLRPRLGRDLARDLRPDEQGFPGCLAKTVPKHSRRDLVAVAEAASVGGERAMIVPADYAQVIIQKR